MTVSLFQPSQDCNSSPSKSHVSLLCVYYFIHFPLSSIVWYPNYKIINLVSLTIWPLSLDITYHWMDPIQTRDFQLSISLSTEFSEPRIYLVSILSLVTASLPKLHAPVSYLLTALQCSKPSLPLSGTRANSPIFPLPHWTCNNPSFILHWEFSGVRIPFLVWITRNQQSTNAKHRFHWTANQSSRIKSLTTVKQMK